MKDPIQLTADGFVLCLMILLVGAVGLLCFTVGLPFMLFGYIMAKQQEKR
jgi:hypothetical protein